MAYFEDIRKDYNEFWLRAKDTYQPYFRNANVAQLANAGRSWTDEEIEKLRLEQRFPSEFNIIRPKINLFSGHARDNIKSIIAGPVEGSDQPTATQLTEVMRYVYDKGNADQMQLNSFDNSLVTGMSLVGIWLDFSEDPIHGDIKFYTRNYNSFVIDPDFQRLDLSDAAEVLVRDFVTREDAKTLLPFVDPKVIDQSPAYSRDDKFNFLRNNQQFFKNRDLLAYDQYYRKVTKSVKEIVDLDTGITLPVFEEGDDLDLLKQKVLFAREIGVNADIVERKKQVVELNVILTSEPVYSGPDPTGLEDYPFAPTICHWYPQLSDYGLRIQGVALGLVDTQRAFNKRMIRKEDIMDGIVNTGFAYRVGEVDVDDIRQTGAGKYIPVNSDQPFEQVFRELNNGSIPQGWQEETSFLNQLSSEVAGINDSMMGQDEGGNSQVSGRLAEVRAANGLKANRAIFDRFEQTQKILGKKVMQVIQKNYGPGKIRRILNEEPTEQFFSGEFQRYDAVIKESVNSQSQRDAFYFEIIRLIELFGPEQIPISLALDNLPMAGAEKVQEAIQEREQKQQEQAQAQEEDRRRSSRLRDSITEENLASAELKRARMLQEISEAGNEEALGQERRSEAVLNQARAIAEIDKLNNENFLQLAQFIEFLLDKEEQNSKQNLTESEQAANRINEEVEQSVEQPDQAAPQNELQQQQLQQLLNPQQGGLDGSN